MEILDPVRIACLGSLQDLNAQAVRVLQTTEEFVMSVESVT
jgi:hypothetical protein